MMTEPWQRPEIIVHSQLLLSSYRHWFDEELLLVHGSPKEISRQLFEADFVLLSHGTEADPIYNYGNRTVLTLWERDWETLLKTPSRQSADDQNQGDRNQVMNMVQKEGFRRGFSGERVTASGRKVRIENVTLWNIIDEQNNYLGQAATFANWTFLD